VARAGKLGEYYYFLSAYDHDNLKAVQGHRTKKPYMVNCSMAEQPRVTRPDSGREPVVYKLFGRDRRIDAFTDTGICTGFLSLPAWVACNYFGCSRTPRLAD
jgi:hypothetical protein